MYGSSEATREIPCSLWPPKEDAHTELAAIQRGAIRMIKRPEGVTSGERLKELNMYTLAKLKAEGMWKLYQHPQKINTRRTRSCSTCPRGMELEVTGGKKRKLNYLLEKLLNSPRSAFTLERCQSRTNVLKNKVNEETSGVVGEK